VTGKSRQAALKAAVEARFPLAELQAGLAGFPWDSEPLVELHRDHVTAVLRRVVSGEWTASDAAQWAELLEGRDDIGFAPEDEALLKTIIFEISNPDLYGPTDPDVARGMLRRLASPPGEGQVR